MDKNIIYGEVNRRKKTSSIQNCGAESEKSLKY